MNSPQQIAEALAWKYLKDVQGEEDTVLNLAVDQVLQSIPLVELLKCATQLKRAQGDFRRKYSVATDELETLVTPYDNNLDNLNTKLKQQGIIE